MRPLPLLSLAALFAVLLAPRAAAAQFDPFAAPATAPASNPRPFGLLLRLNYGLGRNFTPVGGVDAIEHAYVSSPTLEAGIGAPGGVQFTLRAGGLLGHNGQTPSQFLFGPSVRIAADRFGGAYARLSFDYGLAEEGADSMQERASQADRAFLFGLHSGVAVPVNNIDSNLEVGLRVGKLQDDNLLFLIEMQIGLGYVWPL